MYLPRGKRMNDTIEVSRDVFEPFVNGGAKLSTYGGIKLTTYLKSLLPA
jgi:hypothetical protein